MKVIHYKHITMGKHKIPGLALTITAPAEVTAEDMLPLLVGILELLQYDKGPIANTRITWEASLKLSKQQLHDDSNAEAPCLVALATEVQLFASVMIVPAAMGDLRKMVASEYGEPFENWEVRFFEVVKAFTDFDFIRCVELGAEALYQEPSDIFTFRVFFVACFFTGEYNILSDVLSFVLSSMRKLPPSECLALPFIQAATAFALEESGDAGGNIDKSVGGSLWKMVVDSLEMVAQYNKDSLLGVSNWAHPYAVHTLFHLAGNDPSNLEANATLDKYEPMWVDSLHLAVHLWWHKALVAIEKNDYKAALLIYDTKMDKHIVEGDQYALSDGAQLLMRTYVDGAITANDIRISPLAAKWAHNATNKYLVDIPFFYTNMAAMVPLMQASGGEECAAIIESLARISASAKHQQHKDAVVIVNALTNPTTETLTCAWRQGSRTRWASVGGSLAQREMFLRYVITHPLFPFTKHVVEAEALKHPKQLWITKKL